MKGLFDKNRTAVSFIVTGSARLDYYRKGGDSLQGRYHYYRLHPFSPMECEAHPDRSVVARLLRFGGFPEPFLKAEERFHRRWMRERAARVIQEDLRDLEHVREVSMLELLLHHLPACVGSPLSVNSLCRLLQVSHDTVERWIGILERLYVCYRIPPFGSKRIRAVRKEKKLYFWDWSCVPDAGARFENMVASQLLKYCHFIEDTEGYAMELRFIRDTDKREIDFAVLRDGRAEFAVENQAWPLGPRGQATRTCSPGSGSSPPAGPRGCRADARRCRCAPASAPASSPPVRPWDGSRTPWRVRAPGAPGSFRARSSRPRATPVQAPGRRSGTSGGPPAGKDRKVSLLRPARARRGRRRTIRRLRRARCGQGRPAPPHARDRAGLPASRRSSGTAARSTRLPDR
ncbi:MAG: ATP-binding protein [Candidatus Riflebacteria bacterium]|nr:ATP-binding protein [Candidatus Riflebacteria bacterium]